MSAGAKRLVLGSMIVAGAVALAAVMDLVLKFPFSGQMVMDILFLISAAVVLYLGYDTMRELR